MAAGGGKTALAETTLARGAAPPIGGGYAWFVVAALSLTNMVAFLERQIVTLLYGPIKKAFNASDTQVSILSGLAFIVFATVFGLFFGRMADRKNRKWIITLGVIAWSFATMACGLARSFVQLFLARISVGVGEATLGPSAMSMIADYFPKERLARALSLYTASVAAGAGLALVAGGAVIAFVSKLPPFAPFGGAPFAPWQMSFLLVGAVGMVVIVPLLFVKEPARQGSGPESQPIREVFAHVGRRGRFYFTHVGGFALGTVLASGTVSWIPSFFIRAHGWAAKDIGYAYGLIVAVGGVAGVLFGARVAEWMESRGMRDANMRLPLIATGLAAIPTIAAPLVPDPKLALGLLAIASVIGSMATAPVWAALQLVTPGRMRGQVVAMFSFVVNIVGMGMGPLVIALFTDFLFKDESQVGLSIVTATLVLKPVILLLYVLSLRGYREGLDAQDALEGAAAR